MRSPRTPCHFADSPTRHFAVPLLLLLAALVIAATFTGCGKSDADKPAGAKVAKYFCPMHPTYTSDRPGDCPICNMKLVPIKDASAPAATNASANHATVPGRVAIAIAPEKRQMIGVRTATVEKRALSHLIHASGIVTHDERRVALIAPRFGGWVRTIYVDYTGAPVAAGQPLFSVYSPELFGTQNEYLIAWRNFKNMTNASPTMLESARRLRDSARRRLELMQVSEEEITQLEDEGRPLEQVVFRAPVAGHVVTKNAVAGKSFMPGETLYEIADLSHLWVKAAVFEYELPNVRVGQKAKIIFPYRNNESYESEVTFIDPHLDPQTRRAEVRLELDNPPDHRLRPDMWADVEIQSDLGEALTVPASAVIDTGTRWVAFVDRDDQHLEPRDVKIGAKTDEYFQVLDGLTEGERVVTRALFLVDSESQLKAAISGMGAAGEHKH